MGERETHAGASGPGLQSQLGHSCAILSRLPPLSEPHPFPSNVEQVGSGGPSSAVSYAVDMGEEAVWIDSGPVPEVGLSRLWAVTVSWPVPPASSCPVWPDCLVCLSGLDLGPVALQHREDICTCWELSFGQHFWGEGGNR